MSQLQCADTGARSPSYRQGPADAGQHTVEAEEVDQVKDENHYQVADGDDFKEAVGAIVNPRGASHTDEGDQQGDLWQTWKWAPRSRRSHRKPAGLSPCQA